jgi:rubrerythrin
MPGTDWAKFTVEDLLLAAARSEAESSDVYARTADRVRNAFLKDRLRFLAAEEEKHQAFVETLYRREVPGKDLVLPATTPVPLAAMVRYEDDTPLPRVIRAAMDAELAARDFYYALAERLTGAGAREMARYVAAMEQGHYDLLAPELERAERFADYATSWPMVHEGP